MKATSIYDVETLKSLLDGNSEDKL